MTRFRLTYSILILLNLGLFSNPTTAASKNERIKFDVGDIIILNLRNYAGDIVFTAGEPNKVFIEYNSSDERINVVVEQNKPWVFIQVDHEKAVLFDNSPVSFNIQAPANTRLFVNSVTGSISSSGISGKMSLATISGDINLSDSSGDIDLTTVSGNLIIKKVDDADFSAESVSGDIEFSNSSLSGEGYELKNVSGNISLRHSEKSSYFLESMATIGAIENKIGNEIVIKGDLLNSARFGPVKAERESKFFNFPNELGGASFLVGSYNNGGIQVNLRTISGNITLDLDK